jgi:tetratricopeptide (TPR) repeat protein
VGKAAVNRLLKQAVEQHDAGRPSEAEALCGDILTQDPAHVSALHLSAVIAFVTDRAAQGAVLLHRVFSLDPDHAPALGTLGDEAAYRKAIELDPNLTRARFNLAIALAGQRRLAEAEEVYRAVIARDPAYHGAWLNLGNVLLDQNKADDAIAAYRHALAADPDDATLHCNLGSALRGQRQFEDAISHFRRATRLAPDSVAAFRSLGLALYEAGRPHDAVQAYRQASVVDPGDAVNLSDLGACLFELRQFDEAIAACELAVALDPDYAPAHTNLGIILDEQNDIEAAVAAHRRAVAADPAYAKGHANLAVTLRKAGEIDEALAVSHHAVALDPGQALARFNHSHYLLLNGDFKNGFADYQWGRQCRILSDSYPTFSQPEWQGEAFSGRTLLLFAEQGLGDALQFVRYLPMVMALGGSIVLQVQPALVPLLRMMPGVAVVPRGEPLPPFDLQLGLMSLPLVFGTTLDTIPTAVPYLHADPAKLNLWRRALGDTKPSDTKLGEPKLGDTTSLKVGVVWAGNPRHQGDRYRSLSAEAVLPRLIMPGVQLYSLQKEPRPADVLVLAGLGTDLFDLAPALGDFADTAAAVGALDLVIAVDTSVAHLAGALGRPVWVLLPHSLDWRWLRDREDSPWYPTMRLFRQHKPQAWDGVMARVSAELARVAAGERKLIRPPSTGEGAACSKATNRPRLDTQEVVDFKGKDGAARQD